MSLIEEPILKENTNRWILYPIKYKEIWRLYKQQVASFWTPEEIDLTQDTKDWNNLDENERNFIKYVLAFFAASDGIVIENLASRFLTEIQIPEIRSFYSFQIMMENIHSETYALLIETFIKDNKEQEYIFNAISNIDVIKKKADFVIKWLNSENKFHERLVAYACVEGILFSGSFCAIYWLKKRGLMPGLTFSNELISRDEGMHTDFACYLYNILNNKLSFEEIKQIIMDAVEVEEKFIKEALKCDLIGINSELMIIYIKFVADQLSKKLGYEKIYNSSNPFEWMQLISLQGKTNFFEKRVGDYQKANVLNNDIKIDFNTDF